ncbi:hypothetical protein J3T78_07215 [Staphylococcus nepalensis]|uniref:SF4 helicase domain-containing protein n=1 Tax=Staphylococcus nepalensis TaxID=214473 RepID=A0ABS3L245_9STAP|nr:DnaB-like helicase C-terminal domain-containing protein [Staphylococcus nepalensis]MBO1214608.1 hypothetical protein [Staphylococcus nepalensis]MBO1216640.1 hypothetical protein [Staphylococcus nepalensis]MBO1227616.1 hypothetical protein [Staphylococcus nepalensis]MBO1235694.1 hypothetical protein [Staphylococcus nepalensis]MBO1237506.1 hypothetical protein [Staphylococcus nepalensis]
MENINTQYFTGTAPIPTGFKTLDDTLDGGLYEGLYVIGALSSLGKTTFVQQIADQVAQQGKDVLFFSMDMTRTELTSKSISRETYLHTRQYGLDEKNAKTSRGIIDGSRYHKDAERGIEGYNQQEIETIEAGFERHKEYAGNLYIVDRIGGIDNIMIRDMVRQHEMVTGNTPVVIVDYLQLMEPAEPTNTIKQNTDEAVRGLKRLSNAHHTPVFAISAVPRSKYNKPLDMASFKESGGIEYSADVLLALDFKKMLNDSKNCDVDEEKKKTPRNVTISILKNRLGETGHRVDYKYYPAYNMFEEVGKFNPMPSAESDFKDKIVSKW